MIHVGTSGFSYDDWKGVFYPPDLPKNQMLPFYCQNFKTLEVNFTYYAVPRAQQMERMASLTPPGFRMVIKANEGTTHKLDRAVAKPFLEAIEPIRSSGKLAAVLAQFPYSFKNVPESRKYLSELREDFEGRDVVVEFRHISWIKKPVLDFLKQLKFGFCCVDEPKMDGLLPPVAAVTSDIGYLRFHSRDASKWYEGGGKERYNYLYTKEEMTEWVPKVKQMSGEAQHVYVFFNNCHAGQAATNAVQFREMLEEMGILEAED